MGKHTSDTHTVRWEIYYIHLQSGHMLFSDMLQYTRQSAAAKICKQTYIDRYIGTELLRITAV